MTDLVITGRVLTPFEEHGWIAITDGRVEAVGGAGSAAPAATETQDLAGHVIAPGFVDLHVHGGGGAHFMSGDPADCSRAAGFHAAHGTTSLLATTVTAPPAVLARAVAGIAACDDPLILGTHLEGPWLSEIRRGAQDPAALRDPDPAELESLAASGTIRMVSLAPELPGALEAIGAIRDTGAVAALAHTDATYDQAMAAVEAGARHAIHTFNGMRPLHHREPGIIGAVLDADEVSCELIADGLHVHPAVMRLVRRAKGNRTVLVTDAIEATGLPDGDYSLGAVPITVTAGRAETAAGNLAGSTLTMDAAVRHAHAWLGVPLPHALAMASTAPADVIGAAHKGRLEPGADADLVVLDEQLRPTATYLRGQVRRYAE
jgi:N-acetylglucosamine-6-phosphate deacetylase